MRRANTPKSRGAAVVVQLGKKLFQQSRPCNPAVMRPQYPPQRFSADPGPTALVGDRWAPAADTIVLPFHDRPAHRTSTSDDHPPSLPPCAPTHAACASVVMMAARKGWLYCFAAAS